MYKIECECTKKLSVQKQSIGSKTKPKRSENRLTQKETHRETDLEKNNIRDSVCERAQKRMNVERWVGFNTLEVCEYQNRIIGDLTHTKKTFFFLFFHLSK